MNWYLISNYSFAYTSKDGTQNYYYGLDLISNNSQYYVHNAHGDVLHLTNSSGESVKHYTYEGANRLTQKTAGDLTANILFTKNKATAL